MTTTEKASPIEVWLSQQNMAVSCTVVHEDETTRNLDVDAMSLRGAMREMTGWFCKQGYTPVGRWEEEFDHHENPIGEACRRFKIASTDE